MITVNLQKDLKYGKFFVVSWYFTKKNNRDSVPDIPGLRVTLDEKNIRNGFFKHATRFYYESGTLVDSHGLIVPQFSSEVNRE